MKGGTTRGEMKEPDHVAHYRKSDGAIQSVEDHLHEVSALAKSFADKVGLGRLGELMGLLHDLGKYSLDFQLYIRSAVGLLAPDNGQYVDAGKLRGKIDHSTAGAQWNWSACETERRIGKLAAEMVSLCVVSHHSGLIDMFDISGEGSFLLRLDKSHAATHCTEASKRAHISVRERLSQIIAAEERNEQLRLIIQKIHGFADDPV
ncbi:MAG: CRISPR-associated endonuclease Cas3'', partial [Verrucomicrobia bacterium]|nr:CRISPR-associated endonuclease Cas3'' [Verrucomicrobiota bacterium]